MEGVVGGFEHSLPCSCLIYGARLKAELWRVNGGRGTCGKVGGGGGSKAAARA